MPEPGHGVGDRGPGGAHRERLRFEDWGVRSPRWGGIRSEVLDVQGTAVSMLRAGDDADGEPHLLVHGLGGSSTDWLEVMGGLATSGPVVAVDLPGFGSTEPPARHASRVEHQARFVPAVLGALGWERAVVHANSMGGMIAVFAAAAAPARVSRLVLASPALPSARRDLARLAPATVLRFAPFVVPQLGERVLSRAYDRMTPEQQVLDTARFVHADPSRISPAMRRLAVEQVTRSRTTPWRLPGFATAAESVVTLLLGRRRLVQAARRVQAPTLLVWGDRDRLIGRPVIDQVRRRRADWDVVELPGVGHVPMLEAPDAYLEAVTAWRPSTSSSHAT